MKKILASAYACEPNKGSEPGVGWNWVQEISKTNEVWVFTRDNNRQAIEQELEHNPKSHLHFVYISVPKWLSFWKKGQRGVRTYYYLWQFFAFLTARKLHKKIQFDVGHHITFVNDWLWTFLCLLPISYIWGPIGSHPFTPAKLLSNPRSYALERIRVIIQTSARILDPLYWLSAMRAHTVVAINNETANVIPLRWLAKHKTIIEPAIGIEPIARNKAEKTDKYNLLFVGRFAAIKAPHIAIDAFANFLKKSDAPAKLTMIGTGPELPHILKRINQHEIQNDVEIVDWMGRKDVLIHTNKADVFLFPSMECGGMVVLEAMAYGVPVVCLKYGGPGSMVSDDCGIKIPIENTSESEIIEQLGDALVKLTDKNLQVSMSKACIQRINQSFLWQHKHTFSENLYQTIIDKNR